MLNWMRRLTADGVVFYPPEGRRAAYLRIREHVRPLRRLRDLRAGHLAGFTGAADVQMSDAQALVNHEGEHAAMYTIKASVPPDRIEFSVGVIYGDDSYSIIEAFCVAPELADTCRRTTDYLTRNLPIGLGVGRRRRFAYQPPEGWQPLAKSQSVSWYPPDFPKHRAVIRVFDGVPAIVTKPTVLHRQLFDDPQNDLASITDASGFECLTDSRLTGAYEVVRGNWRDGAPSAIVRVTLHDKNYAYNARLEVSEPYIEAARTIFDGVVRSILPIPSPAPPEQDTTQLIHWAE